MTIVVVVVCSYLRGREHSATGGGQSQLLLCRRAKLAATVFRPINHRAAGDRLNGNRILLLTTTTTVIMAKKKKI